MKILLSILFCLGIMVYSILFFYADWFWVQEENKKNGEDYEK